MYIYITYGLVVSTPLKNISQLGWLFPINGRIEFMFQTTNQYSECMWIYWISSNKPPGSKISTDPSPTLCRSSAAAKKKTLDLRVPQRNGVAWLVWGQGMNLIMWYLAGAMTWKSNKHGGLSIKPIGLISSQPADIKGIFMVYLVIDWDIFDAYWQDITNESLGFGEKIDHP